METKRKLRVKNNLGKQFIRGLHDNQVLFQAIFRELSRMFRKWRIQLSNEDIRCVDNYLDKLKMRNKVLSRVNYEKRKSKALTMLAFKMTKIKLRNYFTKYWANTKGITVEKLRSDVEENRVKYSELRKEDKIVQMDVASKNKSKILLI